MTLNWGDIYNLTVHQFEKLLKKEKYVKLKINLENENYVRLLEHLVKNDISIIPGYDGYWIDVRFAHEGIFRINSYLNNKDFH